MVSRGTVTIDTMVVINVTSVITVTSMPSLRQKMVPYVATGIEMMMVLMATDNGWKPANVNVKCINKGNTTKRKAVVRYTLMSPAIFLTGRLAIDEPIINKAPGMVMPPNKVRG